MDPKEEKNQELSKELLRIHEGEIENIYFDTKGIPTGGVGHAFIPGSKLPWEIWESIYNYDYGIAVEIVDKLMKEFEIYELDEVRKSAFINMAFTLGIYKFRKFAPTFQEIKNKNWKEVAKRIKNTQWYKDVKNTRGNEICYMWEEGKWPDRLLKIMKEKEK